MWETEERDLGAAEMSEIQSKEMQQGGQIRDRKSEQSDQGEGQAL